MQDRLREIREGLFFIVGPHRAGTTLLQAMLSSHSAITIPPETGYFDQVWPRQASLGPLTNDANLRSVGEYLNGPNCSVSDLALDWNEVTRHLVTTPRGYDDLFAVMLAIYADSRGKRRVGEKSPRHLFEVHQILKLFPQARFICLIRDPRAVVRSEMETNWGSKSVGRITKRWCRVMEEARRLRQELSPQQFREVRYEDLVREPETILRGLCEFLGEPFEPEMLKFQERPASEHGFRPDEVWKHNTLRPVDASRVDQWREQLSPAQIALIENRAGAWLTRMRYCPSGLNVSWSQLVWAKFKDRCRWNWEVIKGILRGRGRRRPWKSVLKDVLGKPS